MAQLKDTVISGSLRVTDTTYTTTADVYALKVPTSSGSTAHGVGTAGQILHSNGTASYWGAAPIPTSAQLGLGSMAFKSSSDYSATGHTHTTAQINNFTSAVDGRITRDKILGTISTASDWSGDYSFVEGESTKALGYYSHAEGSQTTARAYADHAEGFRCQTEGTDGSSHAEGTLTTASEISHAEGMRTYATNVSHSEGHETTAIGTYSHVEGDRVKILGRCGHGEGRNNTILDGCPNAHVGGFWSTAGTDIEEYAENIFVHGDHAIGNVNNQVVFGPYNATVADAAFIVGNGSEIWPEEGDESTVTRSNAMYVTTAGDIHVAGNIYIGNEKVLTGTNNAGFHNSIYRGKSLGTAVTAEQWAAIANGTFDDLYIGDYWTLSTTFGTTTSNIRYEIAGFNYWWGCQGVDASLSNNKPHIVLVPKDHTYGAIMNSTNTTNGGYVNSLMYTTNLTNARAGISALFGNHLYTVKRYFTSAVSSGKASNGALYDSTVDLMSETMVFGHPAWGYSGHEIGTDKTILPLFALNPESYILHYASYGLAWWLCTVGNAGSFSIVNMNGRADCWAASSTTPTLRFVFAIC